MISCRYEDNEIIAKAYVTKFGYAGVKKLKTEGRKGLLKCKDPNCEVPLEYVHGEKRKYYFRHRKGNNTECIYSNYNPGEDIKKSQYILHSHFSNFNNVIVKADEKLISNHITHLVIEIDGSIVLAVEFIKDYYPDREWDRLYQEYVDNDIQSVWIILSEPSANNYSVNMSFFTQKQIEENLLNCVLYLDTESKDFSMIIKHDLSNFKYPKLLNTDVVKGSFKLKQFYNTNDAFDIEWLEKAKNYFISLFNEMYYERERNEETRLEKIRKRNLEREHEKVVSKKDEEKRRISKLNSGFMTNNPPARRSNNYSNKNNYFDKDIARRTVHAWLKRYMNGEENYRIKLNEKIYNDRNDFEYYKMLQQIKNDYEKQKNTKAVECCDNIFEYRR